MLAKIKHGRPALFGGNANGLCRLELDLETRS